jgi:hypothetical protein
VTVDEVIRWGWTILTALGMLFAGWNLREVLIDNWAVSQIRRQGLDVLRMQTHGAVYDHTLILLALMLDFVAGVGAVAGVPLVPLVALIAQALALIALSFSQTQRRRHILRTLRLRREKADD